MAKSLSPTSPRFPPNASFPSPLLTPNSQQAASIISSRMTDIASEDGEDNQNTGSVSGRRPNTATSYDPIRPGTGTSAQTRPSTRAPPSRRGLQPPRSPGIWRSGEGFGGPGGSVTNSSRPQSSTSRTSRTHVPSLASHAFFRPMSSQRLQAQRASRTPKSGQPETSVDASSEANTNTNRHSLVTNATELPEPIVRQEIDPPPPSRGTDFTEQDDRGTANASVTENATVQSVGGSERPLQHRSSNPRPLHLNLDRQGNGSQPKSPRPFSANFIRSNGSGRKESHGRERLSSSTNSPTCANSPVHPTPKAGINYQYFSGNTVFFWGGRLQNTRDRPVNIASGIFVVAPSILFLVFS